jgi:hypothetical protein
MSASNKKIKNESFNDYKSFRNLFGVAIKITQSYLKPFSAVAANSPPAASGEKQPDDQYYVKFSNEFVINAFLFYLAGGKLGELPVVDNSEASL